MGTCTSTPPPPKSVPHLRPLNSTASAPNKAPVVKNLQKQPSANAPPLQLDSLTHTLHQLSTTQLEFRDIAAPQGAAPFARLSPTKRHMVIPGGTGTGNGSGDQARYQPLSQSRPQSAALRYARPAEIEYAQLSFQQSLGQGTYGEVSRGSYRGRKVAIKKLFPGSTTKERMEVVEDFDKEVAILTKLRHPRIVQYVGCVNKPPSPLCLVFELCEGSVALLLKMVRRANILISWRIGLQILRDAADAVHYLHAQTPKVIHRDLKAENLLLESNFRCKLTDFGLSRYFDSRRPSTMTVCGTPCWVAPEVFRNEPYDEKVDIYSFAVLIWEMCAAKKPYGNYDCKELSQLVGNKGLRPEKLTHVPRQLNELMEMCWNEMPSKRPTTSQLRQGLECVHNIVDEHHKLGYPMHVTSKAVNWDMTNDRPLDIGLRRQSTRIVSTNLRSQQQNQRPLSQRPPSHRHRSIGVRPPTSVPPSDAYSQVDPRQQRHSRRNQPDEYLAMQVV